MAALGFSVLMREWRRGMAFDPWHWKPLFKTVSGHHSPSVFFLHLCYRRRNRPAPLDLIKSSQATLLEERDPDWTASAIVSTVHTFPFLSRQTLKVSSVIDHLGAEERKGGGRSVKILFYS